MKKLVSVLLLTVLVISSFSSKFVSANASVMNNPTELLATGLTLPDLGIEEKKIDYSNMRSIENIISEMSDLSAQSSRLQNRNAANIMTLNSISEEYIDLEQELFEYGVIKLSDAQASKYVYGTQYNERSGENLAITSSVNYPTIAGITFYTSYYTWKESNSSTTRYDFCRVYAIATPGYNGSKLVTSLRNIDMLKSITIADLGRNFAQIFTTNTKDAMIGNAITSLVGGKAEFAFSVLSTLVGDVWPTNSSTSFSSLTLNATANSTVYHHWLMINGTYYFRIATQMANIEEQWTTIDTAGKIYTKQNSYRLTSENFTNPELIAIRVNNNVAYNCGQRYAVKTSSGGSQTKAYLTPFFASLPIHFAN